MPDGSNIYAGVAGYFGKPDHTGKAGVFARAPRAATGSTCSTASRPTRCS